MIPNNFGFAFSTAARSLKFGEPSRQRRAVASINGFESSSAGCSTSASDLLTNQLIAQLRQLTAADGARFAAKYRGGMSLPQQHMDALPLFNSKHQQQQQQPCQSILLSAVPDQQLPSFYRADSRARCSCCKRQAGGASSRCHNIGEETGDNEKGFSSTSSGIALLSGGVSKKRRQLVQTKICDMFPNKKKMKLSCQSAAPQKK